MHPDTLQMLVPVIHHWLAVSFPLGILLGVLLGPARVSGVDFRQWFWDPTQTSEVKDDSWIGLVRGAAHVLAGALAISLLLGAAWQWLYLERICRLDNFTGVFSILADCIWYWWNWKDVTAIAAGVVVTQVITEMAWNAGLKWLPALPARGRTLVDRSPRATLAQQAKPPATRRIVICCDGTWNWPRPERETNVVRLLRAIKPVGLLSGGQPVTQIVHYHLGVGTGNILDRAVGGGTGVGLSDSVKSCYGFLVDNYEPGDEILLFGFSRGSYVVRSVAGMVGSVGLLQKREMTHFYDAWDWYSKRHGRHPHQLDVFARDRNKPETVTIQCIGVWDTVGALGIPGTRFCAQDYTFHQTALGPYVHHAFQALAIDEKRGNFQAAPWVPPLRAEVPQVLEQVWFAGVHSNIGGGYDDHGLSDTTLLWMVSQILQYHLLDLDTDCIVSALDQSAPYLHGKLIESRTAVWVALGCAVPRPVGMTSVSEKIHESVRQYHLGFYAGDRRQDWLKRHTDIPTFYRTQFEIDNAVKPGHKKSRVERPKVQPEKIGLCDWIMQQVGGSS
jgi:uncharacterized protein (DUF2235 family)